MKGFNSPASPVFFPCIGIILFSNQVAFSI